MCGACPGGTVIPRLSAYAALAGIRSSVAGMLQEIAGRRLTVRAFGDAWTVRDRLGKQQVLPGLEEVAAAVAAGPLDWDAVARLTGQEVTGRVPDLSCPALPVLQEIAAAPLSPDAPRPELTAGEFAAGLLVHAANRAGSGTGAVARD